MNERMDQDDRAFIGSRLIGYFNKYRCEKWPVISVEKGFSKTIYEDKYVHFIYSGRPDVVLDYGQNVGIGPMDHKSESRESDIAPFNNQFVGYLWALNANFGIINYIGLQQNPKEGDIFRRKSFHFTDNQIAKWQSDMIEWYYAVRMAIAKKKFMRSWRCEGKYGTCLYHTLCTSGTKNEEKMKIKRDFVKLEQPYRSW